jgi:hypothetical protein
MFGHSPSELFRAIRAIAIETTSSRLALIQLFVEKGMLTEEDLARLQVLQARHKADMDQRDAARQEELLNEDSPAGERLRQQKQVNDTLSKLFGSFLGGLSDGLRETAEEEKEDEDPKTKLR